MKWLKVKNYHFNKITNTIDMLRMLMSWSLLPSRSFLNGSFYSSVSVSAWCILCWLVADSCWFTVTFATWVFFNVTRNDHLSVHQIINYHFRIVLYELLNARFKIIKIIICRIFQSFIICLYILINFNFDFMLFVHSISQFLIRA